MWYDWAQTEPTLCSYAEAAIATECGAAGARNPLLKATLSCQFQLFSRLFLTFDAVFRGRICP